MYRFGCISGTYIHTYIHIVTVLGTICIQLTGVPSQLFHYVYVQIERLLVCSGKAKGGALRWLLVGFINRFSPFILNHSTFLSPSEAKSLCSTFFASPDMRGVGGLPGMAETPPRKDRLHGSPGQPGRTVTSALSRPRPDLGDL